VRTLEREVAKVSAKALRRSSKAKAEKIVVDADNLATSSAPPLPATA